MFIRLILHTNLPSVVRSGFYRRRLCPHFHELQDGNIKREKSLTYDGNFRVEVVKIDTCWNSLNSKIRTDEGDTLLETRSDYPDVLMVPRTVYGFRLMYNGY